MLKKMKNLRTKFSALVLLAVIACSDDKSDSPVVANDEAAEMIAMSVSSGSGGLTVVIDEAAVTTGENASGRVATCGYSESMDVMKESAAGAVITYNYDFHYDYALTCANALPTSMAVNMTYSGSLDALRMATTNTGAGDLTVETLDATYTYFTINGSYDRTGSFESKVRNQNTSNSTITIDLADITVDKTNRTITGGTASVSITGSVSGKGSFSYSGSIVFLGDTLAELDVNGTKYSLNIETGEITAL
jgi:hypothetical protein